MEFVYIVGAIILILVIYNFKKDNEWQKNYRISMGGYFGLSPEQSKSLNSFDGNCDFNENPIVTNIRFTKNESAYAAFHGLNLMEHKRDGGIGAYGITLRKKVLPGTFLRAGVGKFGMSKSWQAVASGSLYITNKGIVFDGDTKNIKLPWEKIMKDNISPNEIVLEKSNGNPIVLQGTIDPKEAAKFTIIGQMYHKL